jgi:hypothetical protein
MPRHAHATLSMVTTGHSRSQNGVLRTPVPVVHAEFEQANARWEALCKRSFGMDCRIKSGNDEWNERERTKEKISEAKRRQTQLVFSRALRARPRLDRQAPSIGVPPRLWLRRPNATTQLQFALPGMRPPSGFPLSLPVSVQRCFSRTGRNAGRADFPKLPGSGLQVRARVPHSPRTYGLPAAARPNHRARVRGHM